MNKKIIRLISLLIVIFVVWQAFLLKKTNLEIDSTLCRFGTVKITSEVLYKCPKGQKICLSLYSYEISSCKPWIFFWLPNN